MLLEFFAGSDPADLEDWRLTESLVEKARQIEHPNLLLIFESVSLPSHRFVVSQLPAGVPLSQTLSPKGRLPWKTACLITAQVARGLGQLHQAGIIHHSLSPDCIWLQKSGTAQLRLPLRSEHKTRAGESVAQTKKGDSNYRDPNRSDDAMTRTDVKSSNAELPSVEHDVFALGRILYRAITGRNPSAREQLNEGEISSKRRLADGCDLGNLAKYDLPAAVEKMLRQILSPNPAKRLPDLREVGDQLARLSENPRVLNSRAATPHPSMAAFQQSLNRFQPGSAALVQIAPVIETEEARQPFSSNDSADSLKNLSAERAAKIKAATAAAENRRRNRWRLPAATLGSLLILASAIGLWAINANQRLVEAPAPPKIQSESKPENDSPIPAETHTPVLDLASLPPTERPILLQELAATNTASLWETPTTGAPVDFSGLPLAPKLIFVFRPNEIVSQIEGLRTLQSLGPEFNSLVEQWKAQLGMELSEISQLIISLHTNSDFEYEPFFIVKTTEPREFDQLLQLWGRPSLTTTENSRHFFAAADSKRAFFIFRPEGANINLANDDTIPAPVSRFAFGGRTAIEEVASNPAVNPLAGSLRKIADWTDRDRQLNLLFLRNALFNDEGQRLMGDRLKTVNRELAIMIPESVRGGLFSLHLDEGTYLELMLDRNLDLQAEDLIALLTNELRIQRDRLTQFVSRISPSPYWNRVRQRYDNMLTDLFRNLRWDVEHGEVIANCWLAPMAAHNLIAASELVMSFSAGDTPMSTPQAAKGPKTLTELLAIKRDLISVNPPDLNLLMAEIETDVKDEFRDLPFRFCIRMLGSDLEQQGITKNQRPGELNLRQTPLSDMLTAIMVGANPAKDISGPADPNCQLIWVIAEDPESPGDEAILITTRAAAKERAYELPAAFKSEE